MSYKLKYLFLLSIFIAGCNISKAQDVKIDSSFLENFPTLIGSICFETDSMEFFGGSVPAGGNNTYNLKMKNAGSIPVTFHNGKSNGFISLTFNPPVLNPSDEGVMVVLFEPHSSIDTGYLVTEIAITTDDILNPYKFLNLHTIILPEVVLDPNKVMDTVPNIIFDHYNFDFGHHNHGQRFLHTYLITNMGEQPLVVNNIELPPGVEVIDYPLGEILPEEQRILRVRVNTRGRVGVQHYIISVYSNDPSDPVVMLGIHGSVKEMPGHKKASVQCNGGKQRL